jgi:hypothetical protein
VGICSGSIPLVELTSGRIGQKTSLRQAVIAFGVVKLETPGHCDQRRYSSRILDSTTFHSAIIRYQEEVVVEEVEKKK